MYALTTSVHGQPVKRDEYARFSEAYDVVLNIIRTELRERRGVSIRETTPLGWPGSDEDIAADPDALVYRRWETGRGVAYEIEEV